MRLAKIATGTAVGAVGSYAAFIVSSLFFDKPAPESWSEPAFLIPYYLSGVSFFAAFILGVLAAALWIVVLVQFGIRRGSEDSN